MSDKRSGVRSLLAKFNCLSSTAASRPGAKNSPPAADDETSPSMTQPSTKQQAYVAPVLRGDMSEDKDVWVGGIPSLSTEELYKMVKTSNLMGENEQRMYHRNLDTLRGCVESDATLTETQRRDIIGGLSCIYTLFGNANSKEEEELLLNPMFHPSAAATSDFVAQNKPEFLYLIPQEALLTFTSFPKHETVKHLLKRVRPVEIQRTTVFISHKWAGNEADPGGIKFRKLMKWMEKWSAIAEHVWFDMSATG